MGLEDWARPRGNNNDNNKQAFTVSPDATHVSRDFRNPFRATPSLTLIC
jgi:hypothetical protein